MQTQRIINPYAPAPFNGIPAVVPEGYRPFSFEVVHDIVLNANQIVTDYKSIQDDASFALCGIVITAATGLFTLLVYDSAQYRLWSDPLISTGLSVNPAEPTPIEPWLLYPPSSRIQMDFVDLSAAPNTIQIKYIGLKLFPTR